MSQHTDTFSNDAAHGHDGNRAGHAGHGGGHDHHDGHDGHQGHDGHGEGGASHSTLKGYLTGFFLSVFLTALPFWIVMTKKFDSSGTTTMVILGFAAVQIVVHMIYFLHMDAKSENGWTLLALLFTIMVVVITLSGSIWVMFHLNNNMMPGMMQDPEAVHNMHGMHATQPMHDMQSMPNM